MGEVPEKMHWLTDIVIGSQWAGPFLKLLIVFCLKILQILSKDISDYVAALTHRYARYCLIGIFEEENLDIYWDLLVFKMLSLWGCEDGYSLKKIANLFPNSMTFFFLSKCSYFGGGGTRRYKLVLLISGLDLSSIKI